MSTQRPLRDAYHAARVRAETAFEDDAVSDEGRKAADLAAENARIAWRDSAEPKPYELWEEGTHYDTIDADSVDEALETARQNVDRSNYLDADGATRQTLWIRVQAVNTLDRSDKETDTVTFEPDAPDCDAGGTHDWQRPHGLVGGLEENPGVVGHGGGVVVREVCRHCGQYRITDTWAQNLATGEQGLTSVAYQNADYDSLDWASSVAEEEVV